MKIEKALDNVKQVWYTMFRKIKKESFKMIVATNLKRLTYGEREKRGEI